MQLMYRFGCRRNGDFFHGTLQLYEAEKHDAGKELAHAVGTDREAYHRKRLLAVKEATDGGTIYYSKKFGIDAVEMAWQANVEVHNRADDGHWYAPKLETYFREDVLKIIQHLHRRIKKLPGMEHGFGCDISPRQIMTALADDELIFVSYSSDNYEMWIPKQGEPAHLDKAPVAIPV